MLVEQLAPGDRVLTWSGQVRPITWIGSGTVLATPNRRSAATPVIVKRGALGDDMPFHDLRVTKGHAFLVDGVLIPVEFLVNHRTILWDDRAQAVTVYHVELDVHDVLVANGAPAESYRDDGNRWLFQNHNTAWDHAPKPPCLPVLTGGPVVDAAWRRLLDRAGPRPGVPVTADADLHLLADGVRIEPWRRVGDRVDFRLPERPVSVRLASRASAPQELGLGRDPRPLGVAVRRLVVTRGHWAKAVEAGSGLLADGYHGYEPDLRIRWTTGDALVPDVLFSGGSGLTVLSVYLGGATVYEDAGEAVAAA